MNHTYVILTKDDEDGRWSWAHGSDDAVEAAYIFLRATQADGSGWLSPESCALGDAIAVDLDAGCAFERVDFHGVTGLLVRRDSPACPEVVGCAY